MALIIVIAIMTPRVADQQLMALSLTTRSHSHLQYTRNVTTCVVNYVQLVTCEYDIDIHT